MKFSKNIFLILGLVLVLQTACTSDKLAFDVIESPVLAIFEDGANSSTDILAVSATFYDLDKTGILDLSVRIDSIPIPNLEVSVYLGEANLIATYSTDANGVVEFEADYTDLGTASRLEWVGTYDDVPFRIYNNF
ncbi:MAG: hypothetical protein AB8H47_17425 [Bacteroidia bacterium]